MNGTFVKGDKVDEATLKDGDRRQFEQIRFIIRTA